MRGGFVCAWRLDHGSGWTGGEGAESDSAAVPGVKAWRVSPLVSYAGKKSKDALGLVCQEGEGTSVKVHKNAALPPACRQL